MADVVSLEPRTLADPPRRFFGAGSAVSGPLESDPEPGRREWTRADRRALAAPRRHGLSQTMRRSRLPWVARPGRSINRWPRNAADPLPVIRARMRGGSWAARWALGVAVLEDSAAPAVTVVVGRLRPVLTAVSAVSALVAPVRSATGRRDDDPGADSARRRVVLRLCLPIRGPSAGLRGSGRLAVPT